VLLKSIVVLVPQFYVGDQSEQLPLSFDLPQCVDLPDLPIRTKFVGNTNKISALVYKALDGKKVSFYCEFPSR
jgi:hypothetical protein